MIDLLSCNVFIYFISFTYHYHHYPSLTLYYFIQWKIFYIGLLKSFLMWYSLYIHFMLFTLLLLIVILSFIYKFIGFISHLESSIIVITIFFFMNFFTFITLLYKVIISFSYYTTIDDIVIMKLNEFPIVMIRCRLIDLFKNILCYSYL